MGGAPSIDRPDYLSYMARLTLKDYTADHKFWTELISLAPSRSDELLPYPRLLNEIATKYPDNFSYLFFVCIQYLEILKNGGSSHIVPNFVHDQLEVALNIFNAASHVIVYNQRLFPLLQKLDKQLALSLAVCIPEKIIPETPKVEEVVEEKPENPSENNEIELKTDEDKCDEDKILAQKKENIENVVDDSLPKDEPVNTQETNKSTKSVETTTKEQGNSKEIAGDDDGSIREVAAHEQVYKKTSERIKSPSKSKQPRPKSDKTEESPPKRVPRTPESIVASEQKKHIKQSPAKKQPVDKKPLSINENVETPKEALPKEPNPKTPIHSPKVDKPATPKVDNPVEQSGNKSQSPTQAIKRPEEMQSPRRKKVLKNPTNANALNSAKPTEITSNTPSKPVDAPKQTPDLKSKSTATSPNDNTEQAIKVEEKSPVKEAQATKPKENSPTKEARPKRATHPNKSKPAKETNKTKEETKPHPPKETPTNKPEESKATKEVPVSKPDGNASTFKAKPKKNVPTNANDSAKEAPIDKPTENEPPKPESNATKESVTKLKKQVKNPSKPTESKSPKQTQSSQENADIAPKANKPSHTKPKSEDAKELTSGTKEKATKTKEETTSKPQTKESQPTENQPKITVKAVEETNKQAPPVRASSHKSKVKKIPIEAKDQPIAVPGPTPVPVPNQTSVSHPKTSQKHAHQPKPHQSKPFFESDQYQGNVFSSYLNAATGMLFMKGVTLADDESLWATGSAENDTIMHTRRDLIHSILDILSLKYYTKHFEIQPTNLMINMTSFPYKQFVNSVYNVCAHYLHLIAVRAYTTWYDDLIKNSIALLARMQLKYSEQISRAISSVQPEIIMKSFLNENQLLLDPTSPIINEAITLFYLSCQNSGKFIDLIAKENKAAQFVFYALNSIQYAYEQLGITFVHKILLESILQIVGNNECAKQLNAPYLQTPYLSCKFRPHHGSFADLLVEIMLNIIDADLTPRFAAIFEALTEHVNEISLTNSLHVMNLLTKLNDNQDPTASFLIQGFANAVQQSENANNSLLVIVLQKNIFFKKSIPDSEEKDVINRFTGHVRKKLTKKSMSVVEIKDIISQVKIDDLFKEIKHFDKESASFSSLKELWDEWAEALFINCFPLEIDRMTSLVYELKFNK